MTKMIADTGVYYRGETFVTGTEFEVSEESTKRMEAQGLAHRAEIKTSRQRDLETSNQSNDDSDVSEPVEVSTDMKREELDAVATDLGMDNFEQYSAKGELVEAIESKDASLPPHT